MKRTTAQPAPKPHRTHDLRRSEATTALLEAAVNIIAERGTERLTLAQVGIEAGYSRGLPAHCFGDKQGLLLAVVRHIGRVYGSDIAKHDFGPAGAEALRKRITVAYESVAQSEISPGEGSRGAIALLISHSESLTNPAMRDPLAAIDQRAQTALRKDLVAGIEAGDFRADLDPEAEALIIMGSIRGIIWHWTMNPRDVDIRALGQVHVDTLIDGLQNQPQGRG